MGDCMLVFYRMCLLFHSVRFRESAKIAFAQAQNKLKACQKRANYEDGLVRNLEMARRCVIERETDAS